MQLRSPVQRLYQAKFVLVSLVAAVAGLALMLASGWPSWVVVAGAVGSALFIAGVVGIVFQYVGNQDAAEVATLQFRHAIRAEAPAIRATVVDALAYAPHEMLSITSPEVLDRVVENSLAARLGNRELAAGVLADLKALTLRSRECWRNLRITASLAPWVGSTLADPLYVATIRFDYHVIHPAPVLRFACLGDLAEYRQLHADPDITEAWYFEPIPGLDATSAEVFALTEVTVDGRPQTIHHSVRDKAQHYTVRLPEAAAPALAGADGELTVAFGYRGLVQRAGHLFRIDLMKPTYGLTITLNYGGAGIRQINVLDDIASATGPTLSQPPAADPSPTVAVTFDGWVLPKASVAFVWTLDNEFDDHPPA